MHTERYKSIHEDRVCVCSRQSCGEGSSPTSLQDSTTRIPKDKERFTELQKRSEIMFVAVYPSESRLGGEKS